MNFSFSSLIATALLLTDGNSQAQSQWAYSENQNGFREIHTQQNATLIGSPSKIWLRIGCPHDKEPGTAFINLDFTVSPAALIKGFDFGYFEGPDASVGHKKLMKITLTKEGKQTTYQVQLTGWWSSEFEDGFNFHTGSPAKSKNGHMRKIVEGILAGAESIEISVVDGIDPNKVISANFPIGSERNSFKPVIEGIK